MDASTETRLLHKRRFIDFLEADHGAGEYSGRVREMVARKQRRLVVDVNDLRAFDAELVKRLLASPSDYLPSFEEGLEEVVRSAEPKYLEEGQRCKLGFTGSFGFNRVTPRALLSAFLGQMVQVEGIVTKCSVVRPKVVTSVHYCAETGAFVSRDYRDGTSLSGPPTSSAHPTKTDSGAVLTTEYGLCTYRDSQGVTLQEMPESAPPGQLPRSVDVVLEDDLVDGCKPGDRVRLVGVYKALPPQSGAAVSGVFRTLVVALSIRPAGAAGGGGGGGGGDGDDEDGAGGAGALDFGTASAIRELVATRTSAQLFELLGDSLAPSICGHGAIKRALVLVLLGGLEKNLANGAHLRGDINCLMVGDPSVAKSQLLRAVMHVAPLAISTTGRGSSGVGLTAAVTNDGDTGERRLEAGAMVLADGGVVLIDEFDKMSDADRVAIHEVMEQQTVTIAKAGIHASLNARCSVVAAANPIYGSYDMTLSVTRNVALPDSLLSRFDLLFIVLDQANAEADREIAEHVLTMHAYRPPGDDASVGLDGLRGDGGDAGGPGGAGGCGADDGDDGGAGGGGASRGARPPVVYAKPVGRGARRRTPLATSFLKKFIAFAKHRPRKPTITPEAAEHIGAAYAEWRRAAAEDRNATLPVTARTLETMIRLATAHAKMRLANEVGLDDAEAALGVMRFALGAEEVTTRRAQKEAEGARQDGDAADARAAALRRLQQQQQQQGKGAAAAAAAAADAAPQQPPGDGGGGDGGGGGGGAGAAAAGGGGGAGAAAAAAAEEEEGAPVDPDSVPAAAQEAFQRALVDLLQRADDCRMADVAARTAAAGHPLSLAAVRALCDRLADENRVMVQGDSVYRL